MTNQLPTQPSVQLPPTGYEYGPARRKYIEQYGSTLVMNAYLRIALLCLSLVVVGLIVLTLRVQRAAQELKPLVIRIDDVGRATAVTYADEPAVPQYRVEGAALRAWRSKAWAACIEALGAQPRIAVEDLIAGLPVFTS